MITEVDTNVMEWLVKVAKALDGLAVFDAGYGEYAIQDLKITFEGEENTGISVGVSEFGDHMAIRIGDEDKVVNRLPGLTEEQGADLMNHPKPATFVRPPNYNHG